MPALRRVSLDATLFERRYARQHSSTAGCTWRSLRSTSIFAGVVCGEVAMVAGKWWLG
jgi:hypothetical protein